MIVIYKGGELPDIYPDFTYKELKLNEKYEAIPHFLATYQINGYIVGENFMRQWLPEEFFITLAEFRQNRINEIFNDDL